MISAFEDGRIPALCQSDPFSTLLFGDRLRDAVSSPLRPCLWVPLRLKPPARSRSPGLLAFPFAPLQRATNGGRGRRAHVRARRA